MIIISSEERRWLQTSLCAEEARGLLQKSPRIPMRSIRGDGF